MSKRELAVWIIGIGRGAGVAPVNAASTDFGCHKIVVLENLIYRCSKRTDHNNRGNDKEANEHRIFNERGAALIAEKVSHDH